MEKAATIGGAFVVRVVLPRARTKQERLQISVVVLFYFTVLFVERLPIAWHRVEVWARDAR